MSLIPKTLRRGSRVLCNEPVYPATAPRSRHNTHILDLTLSWDSLEKDHWSTAQSNDLWRSQLRRAGSDQQLRTTSTKHVDSLSANVYWSICVDPMEIEKLVSEISEQLGKGLIWKKNGLSGSRRYGVWQGRCGILRAWLLTVQ